MACFHIAGASSPTSVVDYGAAYHTGSPIAVAATAGSQVATAGHAPTGYMCKVTILSLEAHHGGYAADYSVTFSHARQEATTTAKRCIAGQGAVWNESIEFMIMAGHDLSFVVEDSGKPLAQTLGSASLAITTGTMDLPIVRNGDIRGLLKVNIGVADPMAGPTAMTLAPPTHFSPLSTHYSPLASQLSFSPLASQLSQLDEITTKLQTIKQIGGRLAVEPTALAPLMDMAVVPTAVAPLQEHPREAVPVQVERVQRPRLESIQAIPKVLGASFPQAPAILSQAVLPAQTVQRVTIPVPMPAGEMCKVTVVSLEHAVVGVGQVSVKILYNGQEANTPARGVASAGGSVVACNDSIEFPIAASQDLVFMVEDVGRREMLGAVATPVIPGLIELPVLDERRTLRGKLKVAIRVYSGPPLGAALDELPSTATLPAPPTQSWPPTLSAPPTQSWPPTLSAPPTQSWLQSESSNHQTLPPTLTSGMLPTSSWRPLVAPASTAAVPACLQGGRSASQLLQ